MPPSQLGKIPIYTGAWDCAVKTVKKEGFFGLYKGIIIHSNFSIISYTNLLHCVLGMILIQFEIFSLET